jgi:PAS domain S-box-containing protein
VHRPGLGEGIFGVDGRGAISFVHPAAAQMLGWAPSDLLGTNACETLCTRQHDSCPLNLVLNVGDVATRGETEYARRDGTRLPVAITAAPNLAADGGRGAVVVFRDISDRHVVNLVGNALKFTAPGGAVRVGAVPTGREITVTGLTTSGPDTRRVHQRRGTGHPGGQVGVHLRTVPPGEHLGRARHGRHR